MNDVWEILSRSQPVFPTNTNDEWVPYIEGFFQHRRWPRYSFSSVDLSAYGWHYRWVIEKDCLLVIRWSTHYGYHIHLDLPPVSRHGRVQDELEILLQMAEAGVGSRLSTEDIDLYRSVAGLSLPDCSTSHNDSEYLYRASDYVLANMVGKKWKSWRQILRRAEREGWVRESITAEDLTFDDIEDNLKVPLAWSKERGKPAKKSTHICHAIGSVGSNGWVVRVYSPAGEVRAVSAYHLIHDSCPIGILGTWFGDGYPSRDALRLLHMFDAHDLVERLGPEVVFSLGPGRDKGANDAKRRLLPCHELGIFQMPTSHEITDEDWKVARSWK